MTRLRSRLVLSAATAGAALLALLTSTYGQQFQPDPERAHAFGDADLDGKLSLNEFRELIVNGPRGKAAAAKKAVPAAMVEPLFRRLDADGDGFLTIKEFRRLAELRAAGGGMGGPFAKKAGGLFGGFRPARKPAAPATPRPAVEKPVTPEQAKFFETKIRPVLMTKCAQCHARDAEKLKGGLLVDSREGLRKGGDGGPAVVPGDPDASLLIQAIRYDDESLQMPPKERLPESVVADFEQWVKMGAPDPREAKPGAKESRTSEIDKRREHWAFQPPKAVAPPKVNDPAWSRTDVDRFLRASLDAKGLKPVAPADKTALLRRVTFDLIGLPPTADQVEAFLADTSPDAFAKVVDRLLASPRFGERWGRHWLDVARFAESSGKANMLYSQAWRYRDWVIAAFNDDMPYDQFVRAQVAGDLLPAADPREEARNVIATGFLAVGSKTHNTQDHKQFVVDLADEQIDVSSQAFLGLTIACARCHDHKFDPISQRDYYALSGIFQSTQTCYGTLPGVIQNINPSPLIELPAEANLPAATPRLSPEARAALERQVANLTKDREALTPEERFTGRGIQIVTRLSMLKFRLASFEPDGTPRTYAMGVRERFEPVDSPLYARGELDQAGERVPRGLVQTLSRETPTSVSSGSGRRELAGWLASRDNPLTARVMVNRVWLHLFGRGLVASPDNFGVGGQPPSHPELLDRLALAFMDRGWSVKTLIRDLVLTQAYQLGSAHDAHNMEVDPDDALVWRMGKKRLEAEAIRDAMLSIAGELIPDPPVGSAVARGGEGIIGPFRAFNVDAQDMHRAVYLPVVRDQVSDSLAVFDFADPSLVVGERATTSGPSQALFLMNNPFVLARAEAAADRLRAAPGDDAAKVRLAYLRFLGRTPTPGEAKQSGEFLRTFAPDGRPNAAWTAFCQALFASAEFRYID